MVDYARGSIRISCGSTPHHLTLSTDDMQTPEGMRYKVNPPIRDRSSMVRLEQLLRAGKIDWIETDHAPHLKEEKTYDQSRQPGFYMSGIRSLENYASFIDSLSERGYPDELITNITYTNIKKVFTMVTE
jgi:dihydroorotase